MGFRVCREPRRSHRWLLLYTIRMEMAIMEVLAFLVWLSTSGPQPPWDYYNCTTDYDCQVQCEERGETDCEY
jgi:hypothetical protein